MIPFSFIGAGGASAFSPASLPLTGWWKNFGGLPWTGSASAGASGGRTIEGGTAGSSTLDGSGILTLNGTTQNVYDGTVDVASYLSGSAYTLVFLVKPKSPAAAAGFIYDNKQIWGSPGISTYGLAWSSSGVSMWHYDGSTRNATPWKACTADAWSMVVGRYDGVNIEVSVNNGAPAQIASTAATTFNLGIFGLGKDYSELNFCSADYAEVLAADTALSAGNLTSLYAYLQSTYPTAGLP